MKRAGSILDHFYEESTNFQLDFKFCFTWYPTDILCVSSCISELEQLIKTYLRSLFQKEGFVISLVKSCWSKIGPATSVTAQPPSWTIENGQWTSKAVRGEVPHTAECTSTVRLHTRLVCVRVTYCILVAPSITTLFTRHRCSGPTPCLLSCSYLAQTCYTRMIVMFRPRPRVDTVWRAPKDGTPTHHSTCLLFPHAVLLVSSVHVWSRSLSFQWVGLWSAHEEW